MSRINLAKNANKILFGGVVAISLLAWFISFSHDWILAYNDSMSHLNMSRLVFDNQKPGLAQIGSVWLPLSHILSLPLVWMDWAWQSGFAASLISMLAFIFTVVGIYAVVIELTKQRVAAISAAVVAAFNLNLLYLQATPLTEPLYIGLFVGAAYFLVRYMKTANAKFLLPLAFLSALQILTRYDGWFAAACITIIILTYELTTRRLIFKKAMGNVLLFVVPVAFAGLLWLGWNAVIFGDPLYFATGPFSAHAQQEVIDAQGGLITKGDWLTSINAMGYSVIENVGWLPWIVGLFGWLLIKPYSKQFVLLVATFAVLASVIAFNILSLYLGFSILNMPDLNWNPSGDPSGTMFNVRYGILALPFAAVGVGLFVARFKELNKLYIAPLVVAAIVVQALLTYVETPITLRDGQTGSSAFRQQEMAKQLKARVKHDEKVLMSMSYFNPVAHASKLRLDQFIHEGGSNSWRKASDNPQNYAEWIVMSNGNMADPLYNNLVVKQNNRFSSSYSLEYQSSHTKIFKLTPTAQAW